MIIQTKTNLSLNFYQFSVNMKKAYITQNMYIIFLCKSKGIIKSCKEASTLPTVTLIERDKSIDKKIELKT
jgi:hypothetical protein